MNKHAIMFEGKLLVVGKSNFWGTKYIVFFGKGKGQLSIYRESDSSGQLCWHVSDEQYASVANAMGERFEQYFTNWEKGIKEPVFDARKADKPDNEG